MVARLRGVRAQQPRKPRAVPPLCRPHLRSHRQRHGHGARLRKHSGQVGKRGMPALQERRGGRCLLGQLVDKRGQQGAQAALFFCRCAGDCMPAALLRGSRAGNSGGQAGIQHNSAAGHLPHGAGARAAGAHRHRCRLEPKLKQAAAQRRLCCRHRSVEGGRGGPEGGRQAAARCCRVNGQERCGRIAPASSQREGGLEVGKPWTAGEGGIAGRALPGVALRTCVARRPQALSAESSWEQRQGVQPGPPPAWHRPQTMQIACRYASPHAAWHQPPCR